MGLHQKQFSQDVGHVAGTVGQHRDHVQEQVGGSPVADSLGEEIGGGVELPGEDLLGWVQPYIEFEERLALQLVDIVSKWADLKRLFWLFAREWIKARRDY